MLFARTIHSFVRQRFRSIEPLDHQLALIVAQLEYAHQHVGEAHLVQHEVVLGHPLLRHEVELQPTWKSQNSRAKLETPHSKTTQNKPKQQTQTKIKQN
jgi:hypothetical protein